MKFVPADSNHAAQVKTVVEQIQDLPLRAFIGILLSNQGLDLLSQQAANGGRTYPTNRSLTF